MDARRLVIILALTMAGACASRGAVGDCGIEYSIRFVSNDGTVITLDNGTRWQVISEGRVITGIWLARDRVTICGRTMTNVKDGDEVRVTRLN